MAGPARLSIAPVREGRNLTTLAVTIEQEGTVAVARVTATRADIDGTTWEHPRPLDLYPVEACVPLYPPANVGHFDHAQALLDPRGVPFSGAGTERLGGYVRPLQQRPIDAAWLAMIPDWFPPCSFVVHDPPTGGVSIDYTVHIHRTLERARPRGLVGGRVRGVGERGRARTRARNRGRAGRRGARRVVPHSLDGVRSCRSDSV